MNNKIEDFIYGGVVATVAYFVIALVTTSNNTDLQQVAQKVPWSVNFVSPVWALIFLGLGIIPLLVFWYIGRKRRLSNEQK